jgi:hypothetical protein
MDRQYVGIDFQRRRFVVVRMSATGEKLATGRVANEPLAMAAAVAEAGPEPEVCSRPPMGGIGRWTCCRPTGRGSIWPTPGLGPRLATSMH